MQRRDPALAILIVDISTALYEQLQCVILALLGCIVDSRPSLLVPQVEVAALFDQQVDDLGEAIGG